MRFRNAINKPLKFELGGNLYEVEVGGFCEVPDKISYAVKGHGLPLEPVEDEPQADAPVIAEPKASAVITAESDDLLEELTRPDPEPESHQPSEEKSDGVGEEAAEPERPDGSSKRKRGRR